MIIDTHGHYDDTVFDSDREELLLGLRSKGILFLINSGADYQGCVDTLALTKKYPFVYGTLGIHPNEVGNMSEQTLDFLREHLLDEKIVGLGEIGLDYHWEEPTPEIQKKWFREQLLLAKELEKPVVIHSRDAAADTMEIMKEMNDESLRGVIHCFSYSPEMAEEYVRMGFHIGVGGVVTFKNGKRLKETVRRIPMERILLETDSPYLSPEPNRGKRNDSSNLHYVAEEIANLRGITKEEVLQITEENARRLYAI